MSKKDEKESLFCSFCGKSQKEVKKLIAGPTVFVCDECVELCMDIIKEDSKNNKKKLKKDTQNKRFEFEPLLKDSIESNYELIKLKKSLTTDYPVYDNILFNSESESIRTGIFLKKSIVNTSSRKSFIYKDCLVPVCIPDTIFINRVLFNCIFPVVSKPIK